MAVYKIYIKKISFVCTLLLFCIACKEEIKVKEYYYKVYESKDSIPYYYQAVKIVDKNNIREQITYVYNDIDKKISLKPIEYYKLQGNNMLKLGNINSSGRLYLSTEYVDSCITYGYGDELYDDVAAITHCFRGKKVIEFEDKHIESYEFSKTYGLGGTAVLYKVFYDKSFIPIKTERISGYSYINIIVRTNFVPYEFKLLLNREQEWVHSVSMGL